MKKKKNSIIHNVLVEDYAAEGMSLARVEGKVIFIEDLNYADYSMNTWMEEFKADSATEDENKRLAYLQSEKIKVEKVRENILTGMERADSLLKAKR